MRVLVLAGPTGVGKTEVAVELARRHRLDIISADSRQVYTWLDIGTAKPSPALRAELGIHMVDMVEPDRRYSAADYARDARAVMHRLRREGRQCIVVGGSGLYLRALFEPFFESPRPDPELRRRLAAEPARELYERLQRVDPARAAELHPNDRQRVMRALEVHELTGVPMSELRRRAAADSGFLPVYVILNAPRDRLHRWIEARFDAMMVAGLLDEVRRLKEAGFGPGTYVANAYGYAELLAFLDGRTTLDEAVKEAKAKTRAYARRQLTWFRAVKDATWVEVADIQQAAAAVEPILERVLAREPGRPR